MEYNDRDRHWEEELEQEDHNLVNSEYSLGENPDPLIDKKSRKLNQIFARPFIVPGSRTIEYSNLVVDRMMGISDQPSQG